MRIAPALLLVSVFNVFGATAGEYAVFKSSDRGRSWVRSDSGERFGDAPVWDLASDDELVFAGASTGIYYSEDRGRTWTRARTGLPDQSPGISFVVERAFVLAGTRINGCVSGVRLRPFRRIQRDEGNPGYVDLPRRHQSGGVDDSGVDRLSDRTVRQHASARRLALKRRLGNASSLDGAAEL